jgi:CubicO group peptidase (beta-lactamase class C family)
VRDRLERFARTYRTPAVGAALVDLDAPAGKVTADVVGVTRRGEATPATLADQWHIGSCGKALTAALYARLVEQGRASWGTPIPDLFADLARIVHRQWSKSTIDDLFTCRSGLPANPTREAMKAAYLDRRAPQEQRTDAAAVALAQRPDNAGEYLYSNLGYTLAGAAIERLTGKPFEGALLDEILSPLGVTSAGFGPPPTIWGHRPRLQAGGFCIGRGAPQDPADLRSDNPPLITPAGRLHLTLHDWATVQRLFLDGAGLLTGATIDRLLLVPANGKISMGWAPTRAIDGVRAGMQGSNTAWAAAAMMSADSRRIAMAITNDGRTRLLRATALLAANLATQTPTSTDIST